ncbi:MAG: amidohydrolase [Proteobacteria bacterium]|nr:amidohydrolase [Burkholderiales bacterium]
MPGKIPVIDVHSHVLPRSLIEAIAARPREHEIKVETRDDGGVKRFLRDDGHATPIFDEFHDPAAKVAGMERKGIDVSILSTTPFVFFYWLAPERALAAARITNDGIAQMVAAYPDRLRGMATLPMQDADAAIAELERVVRDHGFRALEVGCTVQGQQLSEARFRPILKRAAELGVCLFAHPHFVGGVRSPLECWYLANLIGHPLDTVLMASHLMFSGTLDELPDLNIILAHGGGYLPYQIGRLAHGHDCRTETKAQTKTSPLDLLRRFWCDALTHDAIALRYLVDRVGADRVVLGTDAPYDMGEEDPLGMLEQLTGLSNAQRDQIHGLNALALLGETPR